MATRSAFIMLRSEVYRDTFVVKRFITLPIRVYLSTFYLLVYYSTGKGWLFSPLSWWVYYLAGETNLCIVHFVRFSTIRMMVDHLPPSWEGFIIALTRVDLCPLFWRRFIITRVGVDLCPLFWGGFIIIRVRVYLRPFFKKGSSFYGQGLIILHVPEKGLLLHWHE